MTPITRILETAIYVDDLDAAEQFYSKVLDLTLHNKVEKHFLFYKLDNCMLLIFDPAYAEEEGHEIPTHGAEGVCHFAFRMEQEQLDAWSQRLTERGVEIEHDHQWPNGARSIYFRDPAGNSLELAPWKLWD
ncbi:MAG: VOC family protein [Verrucomicrobiota bacterium]